MEQARFTKVNEKYGILVWKRQGKKPLERPRHRWFDNIKMDIKLRYEDVD
jgi:hypothetical protein